MNCISAIFNNLIESLKDNPSFKDLFEVIDSEINNKTNPQEDS